MDKTRVIIIDDNRDISELYGTELTRAGYAVTIVNKPDSIIDLVDLCDFDIVIVDYMMPGKIFHNGGNIVEYVKDKCCHNNILLVTGHNIDLVRSHGVPVLLKPLDMEDLLSAVGFLRKRAVA